MEKSQPSHEQPRNPHTQLLLSIFPKQHVIFFEIICLEAKGHAMASFPTQGSHPASSPVDAVRAQMCCNFGQQTGSAAPRYYRLQNTRRQRERSLRASSASPWQGRGGWMGAVPVTPNVLGTPSQPPAC